MKYLVFVFDENNPDGGIQDLYKVATVDRVRIPTIVLSKYKKLAFQDYSPKIVQIVDCDTFVLIKEYRMFIDSQGLYKIITK